MAANFLRDRRQLLDRDESGESRCNDNATATTTMTRSIYYEPLMARLTHSVLSWLCRPSSFSVFLQALTLRTPNHSMGRRQWLKWTRRGTVIFSLGPPVSSCGTLAVKLVPKKMKIYKSVPLHFVIRHHYSRLSWAFNFSYWWHLRCHAFPLPFPCVRWDTWSGGTHFTIYLRWGTTPPASHATLTMGRRVEWVWVTWVRTIKRILRIDYFRCDW